MGAFPKVTLLTCKTGQGMWALDSNPTLGLAKPPTHQVFPLSFHREGKEGGGASSDFLRVTSLEGNLVVFGSKQTVVNSCHTTFPAERQYHNVAGPISDTRRKSWHEANDERASETGFGT